MAEANYEDPLSALPTVAPPRATDPRKKKRPELGGGGLDPAGGQMFDGGITHTTDEFLGDDYFSNFPQDGGGMPFDSDPVNQTMSAVAPPSTDGVAPVPGGGIIEQDLLKNLPYSPVPGGDQGIPEDDILPDPVAPVPGGDQGIPDDDILPPGGGDPADPNAPPDPELMRSLQEYAQDILDNPTRYDDELVQQGLAQIDAELADKREGAMTDIEELMSQRGLVGSSVEANTAAELSSDLERERSQFAFDLAREQALTNMSDKQVAAQIAQGALGEETRRWQARRALELQERGLDIDEAYKQASTEIQQRANELKEYGLNLDDAYRQAAMEFEQGEMFGEQQYQSDVDDYFRTLEQLRLLGLSEEQEAQFMRNNPKPRREDYLPGGR